VIALYDSPIRKDRSAVALDMVDASALLSRLHLSGHNVGDRWSELATAWDAHADGKTYGFNDWHAAMAYLGAGRISGVARLARAYHESHGDVREATNWGRSTAPPLIEGFSAFWHGDYLTSVEHLHRTRFIANSFGGDIIDWTLTEAAVRGGIRDASGTQLRECYDRLRAQSRGRAERPLPDSSSRGGPWSIPTRSGLGISGARRARARPGKLRSA
jgi:hypothetical protein